MTTLIDSHDQPAAASAATAPAEALLQANALLRARQAIPVQRNEALPGSSSARALTQGPVRTSLPLGRLLMLNDGTAALIALILSPAFNLVALPVALLTVVALADSDLYRRRLRLSVLDDAPQLWLRGLVVPTAVGGSYLLLGATGTGSALLHSGTAFVLLALLGRTICYRVVTRQRIVKARCEVGIVLGAGPTGVRLVNALQSSSRSGVRVDAVVDALPGRAVSGVPVVALDLEHLYESFSDVVDRLGAAVVLVTPSALTNDQVVTALRSCDRSSCDIFVVPSLPELGSWRCHTEEVAGLPLVRLRRATHRAASWPLKRVFDVVVAGTALLLAAPLLLLCAIGAWLDGGSGVLFHQIRTGLDGKPFVLTKIRSMRPLNEDESATNWNISDDARVSRFGRLVRKTSLDELPQLWNVVRGDMSLVGPRPERPHFVAKFTSEMPHYCSRARVPVGLTGWAQVHGLRGDTSISDRARYDNQYIENWSLWLDLKILLLTVASVLRGTGA